MNRQPASAENRRADMETTARVGLVEWFRPGEHERVEKALETIKGIGIPSLRTAVSWADFHRPEGAQWYDWLLPRLADEVDLLPCVLYTPPSLGVEPHSASPPRDLKAYADFVHQVIARYGSHFDWIELWNEPNNINDWDWRLDPGWDQFCEMVGMAAHWARTLGKKTVLAGMSPFDPEWLDRIGRGGLLEVIDAVGLHGFPGTWDFHWRGWSEQIEQVRSVFETHGVNPRIWITETGYSTVRRDELRQIETFRQALSAPVDRIYWYALQDLHPDLESQEGFHVDERHYHMGMLRADGTPKLLPRLLSEGGISALERLQRHAVRETSRAACRQVLITGGAGFIGTNLADNLASEGCEVLVLDNLSRPGVEENLYWLREKHGCRIVPLIADIRDRYAVRDAVRHADQVFHFAAQVAVTTSILSPEDDFEINARGTLNLLEALRRRDDPPSLVYTSTNKVYGALISREFHEDERGYSPTDPEIKRYGIDESHPLDLYSPYGCSKGAADQYVIDYARIYDLPMAVFRMSCIYGPHQCGTEDQGWVAHFLIRALQDEAITLYGNGKQVRDILFVTDLVEAMRLAQKNIGRLRGQVYNIGGGPGSAVSLLDTLRLIETLRGRPTATGFGPWRPGDQVYYVSDIRRFSQQTGWQPHVGVSEGLSRMIDWLERERPIKNGTAPAEYASL